MAWHSVLARRILPRPTPTPAGDKPPRYISPSPPMAPCPVSGYWSASSRLSEQKAWPAGGFAIRHPPRAICESSLQRRLPWWDAWLGGLLGHEHDDRSNCKGARSDVDEAGASTSRARERAVWNARATRRDIYRRRRRRPPAGRRAGLPTRSRHPQEGQQVASATDQLQNDHSSARLQHAENFVQLARWIGTFLMTNA